MQIEEVKSLGTYSDKEILEYIYNLERLSNHPISSAITSVSKNIENKDVEEYKEIAGHGIYGKIDGKEVVFGNKKLLDKYSVEYNELEDGAIYLGIDKKLEGYISLSEELRSKDMLQSFKDINVKRLVMLTGDNKKEAQKVAENLGIIEVYSELLPQDKLKQLEEIKKQKEKVIFVGDGINDGPVLASADFGIAMGEGTEIASSTADGILLSNNIKTLPEIIKISRKSMRIVRSNIVFSIIIKLVVLALGIIGIAPIWLAVLADTGVTFLTVLNSMRIFKN
jgi:Cd2+/Zn2+-exporting ATPase